MENMSQGLGSNIFGAFEKKKIHSLTSFTVVLPKALTLLTVAFARVLARVRSIKVN